MAEGWGRALAPPGVRVYSAGSRPTAVNPYAVRAMAEVGIDLSDHHSKSVDVLDSNNITTVVTLCADEVCPAALGSKERLHWPLPDPAAETGSEEAILDAFRSVRDQLALRLKAYFGRDR